MQRMIKFELKRSFKNRLFLISLLISLALVTWYSIERIPYCVQLNSEFLNDENLMGFFEISYTNWIGSHNIYLQQNIFYMAIPILATLPFGSSFYDDINRGYARNVCVRAKKKYYLVAKYAGLIQSQVTGVSLQCHGGALEQIDAIHNQKSPLMCLFL